MTIRPLFVNCLFPVEIRDTIQAEKSCSVFVNIFCVKLIATTSRGLYDITDALGALALRKLPFYLVSYNYSKYES